MRLGLARKIEQKWKPFLKAKDNKEEARKETTGLHFVSLLSHTQQLGKGGGKLIKQPRGLLGAGGSAGLLSMAREMQWPGTCSEAPSMTFQDLVLESLGLDQS